MKQYISIRLLLLVAVSAMISSILWGPSAAKAATDSTRIGFDSGATSAVVSGSLPANSSARYVLNAGYGQLMDVSLSAPEGAKLKVTTSGGYVLTPIPGTSGSTGFRGYLPYTGDYYITVSAGSQTVSYSVEVFIPSAGEVCHWLHVKDSEWAPERVSETRYHCMGWEGTDLGG
jgi:hypothetical protein